MQYKKKKKGDFAFDINRPGNVKIKYGPIEGKHKASILQSLGIDELSPLAERWINVTKDFTKYVHRRGAWKDPRRIEEFQGFWLEFEVILVD